MKQTFSELLAEYLRLRDIELDKQRYRALRVVNEDSMRMRDIELEMDRRMELLEAWECT